MSTAKASIVGAFIGDAPPGELSKVVEDIKSLTSREPNLLESQGEAFQKYNEEQLAAVKLPGGSQQVLVSSFNNLGEGRYFDSESQSSFAFDHPRQTASEVQSHPLDSPHADLINSLVKAFTSHAAEHFPSSTIGVFPTPTNKVALVLVASKYSPNNFWNGRWRSQYELDPSDGSLSGRIAVDVHYYEDGNVRLLTAKPVVGGGGGGSAGASAVEAVRTIAALERRYQEELNRAFASMAEGAFKGLRRQLPVTRQKVEWDKISGYRLGQDIGGGRAR